MAYAQSGLIEATDYNNFVGPDPSTTSGQLNAVWGTGNGQWGYGQTPVAQSAATAGLVTATQWSTLINTLNNINFHQTGGSTGIPAVTSGALINYQSTLPTSLTSIYNNHLSFASQGSTITGATFSPNYTATNSLSADTWTFTRSVTFASGDAARYFFNAGGQLNFVTISATNNDGTSRSGDWVTLIATNLGSINAIRATTNGGISGTGGTINTNNTAFGYYNGSTASTITQQITSTTSLYTGDYISVAFRNSPANASGHGDNGTTFYLDFTVYSAARTSPVGLPFNDTINVTWNHRIDIVNPETSYLSNSWGTPIIA